MKQNPLVKPVDPISLRGLSSHAETHWLTFATAMRCYAQCPTHPSLKRVANRHGPTWLRTALKSEAVPSRELDRPAELDPKTGSLAFLIRGAEDALKTADTRVSNQNGSSERTEAATLNPITSHHNRLEHYLALAAARVDVKKRAL